MKEQMVNEIKETQNPARALVFVAHPDDEAFMSGTITKLVDRGVEVYITSVTDGGAGSRGIPREELVAIRYDEAQEAAHVLGVKEYRLLDFYDGEFFMEPAGVDEIAQEIRRVRPDIIFTHTHEDYHGDHRHVLETVRRGLERASSYEFVTPGLAPTDKLVSLYVMDPQGLKTSRGQIAEAAIVVRVTEEEMERRLNAFRAHTSQLLEPPPQGEFDYVERSRREGIVRGVQAGFSYGEGFRQIYGDYTLRETNQLAHVLGAQEVQVFAA